jgi:large subunit ribosomal protein L21
MYAIIENGGKQYRISEGTKVRLEKLSAGEGEEVRINEILAINDGSSLLIGNPYVSGAYVDGKVLSQGRSRKIIVFKYKKRKDYKKKMGHRQAYTELLVEKIHLEGPHGA